MMHQLVQRLRAHRDGIGCAIGLDFSRPPFCRILITCQMGELPLHRMTHYAKPNGQGGFVFSGFSFADRLCQIHIPDAGINVYLFTYC